MVREIKKIVTGSIQYDGAGVKLVRVIGHKDVEDFDPFLMLDAFDSSDPDDYIQGFPWHPHRGIETVTYLIEGNIEHGDNLGNQGQILSGCCQWMTAGRGILHQEMPKPADRMLGVQLWLNLPRKDKMSPPQYRDIQAEMVPKIQEENATVGIISGKYNIISGAVQGDYVKALFLDVDVKAGQQWELPTEAEANLFIYIVAGKGYFGSKTETLVPARHAVLFQNGARFTARAGQAGLRFLLFSARPLQEPVAWGGPIVMNTRQELSQAFREIEEGTFIK